MALTFPRSAASLPASPMASLCTWSKARATSPISSVESTSMGTTSWGISSPSVSLIRRTASGSRVPATSRAPLRSRRSGRIMDLPTATVARNARARTSRTTAPQMITSRIALLRSVVLLAITEFTSCASTECMPLVTSSSDDSALAITGSSAPGGAFGVSEAACCTWACAPATVGADSALSNNLALAGRGGAVEFRLVGLLLRRGGR